MPPTSLPAASFLSFTLLLSGPAFLTLAAVHLLLWREYRRPLMPRWAVALGVTGAADLIHLSSTMVSDPAPNRLLGMLTLFAAMNAIVLLTIAYIKSSGSDARWSRRISVLSMFAAAAVVAALAMTEPAAFAEYPSLWYRSAGNPSLRIAFSVLSLGVAAVAWSGVVRRPRSTGMLILAIGQTIGSTRSFQLAAVARADLDGHLVGPLGLVVLALLAFVLCIGLGSLLIVVHDERAVAIATNTRTERAERMERLGLMSGSVAHDLHNLLGSVMASLYLARDPKATPAKVQLELDALEGTLEHGQAMAARLLAFAKGERRETPPVDVTEWLRKEENQFRFELGAPHSLELDVKDSSIGARVRVDATRLHQLIGNVIQNCRDAAGPERPTIVRITLESRALTRDRPHGVFLLTAGRWLTLRIADDGPGFPPEVLDRVFEPFFTTKGTQGTGLGLATVFAVSRDAGGAVDAFNGRGGGAIVECWLPVLDARVTAAA